MPAKKGQQGEATPQQKEETHLIWIRIDPEEGVLGYYFWISAGGGGAWGDTFLFLTSKSEYFCKIIFIDFNNYSCFNVYKWVVYRP